MKRFLAVLVLFTLTVTFVAPVVAPPVACAATGDTTAGGIPNIPWAQVWQAVKTWGPMLMFIADALVTALTGGGAPPPNPPPPPPPHGEATGDAPCTSGATGVAWLGGPVAAAGWA